MEELRLDCIHEMYTSTILNQQIQYSILENKYMSLQGNIITESSDSKVSKAIGVIKEWINKLITFITKTIPNWIKKQAEKLTGLFKKRKNITVIDDTKADAGIKEYIKLCNNYASLAREIEISQDWQKDQKLKRLKEYEQEIKSMRNNIEDKTLCDKILADAKNGKDIFTKTEKQPRYSGKLYHKETIHDISGMIRETDLRIYGIISDFSNYISKYYGQIDEKLIDGCNEDIDKVEKCIIACKNTIETGMSMPLKDVIVDDISIYEKQMYSLMPLDHKSLTQIQSKINELQHKNTDQVFYGIIKILNRLLSLYSTYANAYNKFITWKTQVDQNFVATAKIIII